MLPALWFRIQPSNWFHGPRPVSKSVTMWWPKEWELGAIRAIEHSFLQSDGPGHTDYPTQNDTNIYLLGLALGYHSGFSEGPRGQGPTSQFPFVVPCSARP